MATSALSCGTIDRDNNELKFLQEALRLVDNLSVGRAATTSSLSRQRTHELDAVNMVGMREEKAPKESDEPWREGCGGEGWCGRI